MKKIIDFLKKIMSIIVDKFFSLIKRFVSELNRKRRLLFIKIKCFIRTRYLMSIDTKLSSFIYTLLILIGLLAVHFIKIDFNIGVEQYKDYYDLFTNTGIALIGLSGIVFTLQIFNQESQNAYMNSVMEKIVDIRFQHIIEYIYLSFVTFSFLIISKTGIDISECIRFYYVSLVTIFLFLGLDLFITTRNSNKYHMIKKIEKRINRMVLLLEKDYQDLNKYCKKYNINNITFVDSLNSMNGLFRSQIQCINSILKNSINDPLLFANGMDAYCNIIKSRLEKRKNNFSYFNIPFLNEILPTSDNDSFIEKYMLEYLDEYGKIALNNSDRDLLSIIQNTYHKILILGKDNRYNNSDELELTIKVVFSYYLNLINDIVLLNNENMLFDTVEVFKDLFINKSDCFYGLVGRELYDKLNELTEIALEKKSLMNFRNIQCLISITSYAVLNKDSSLKKSNLDLMFKSIKKNCVIFAKNKELIKNYDGARIYLNYIFSCADKYALINYLSDYYNNNVVDNKFIDANRFNNGEFESYIDFFTDDIVIEFLYLLKEQGYYVTGLTDYKFNIAMIIQLLFKIQNSDMYKNAKLKTYNCIVRCFRAIDKLVLHEKKYSMIFYELHEFYKDLLLQNIIDVLANNENLLKTYIDNYIISIKNVYIGPEKGEFDIRCLYSVFELLYTNNLEKNIKELLNWYYELSDNKLLSLYDSYIELSQHSFGMDGLKYENKLRLLDNVKEKLKEELEKCNLNILKAFSRDNSLNIKSKTKSGIIKEIIKD